MPVHHRLRFLTFPMRASRLCSLWPDMRPLRFRRAPFGRDGTFDPGGATASRIATPHMLPSTVPSVSASAKFFLSWLNPPPHPITVYASHPPSPTTAQHSLPGSALPPYRGRSFTGRIASASPDEPELEVRTHSPPAESLQTIGSAVGDDGFLADIFPAHRPALGYRPAISNPCWPRPPFRLGVSGTTLGLRFSASAMCQSALNFDPGSASNIDPGGGSSTESTGGTRASWSDRRESDGAMRGGLPVGPRGRAGGSQARFLKRQLSFPVSMMSQ